MPWLPRPDIKESNKNLKVHSKRFTWRVITFRDELKSIDFRLETNELFIFRSICFSSEFSNKCVLIRVCPVSPVRGHRVDQNWSPNPSPHTYYLVPISRQFLDHRRCVWTGQDARRSEGTSECTRIVEFQTFCFQQTFSTCNEKRFKTQHRTMIDY